MRILRIILAIYFIAFVAFIVLIRLAAPGPDGQAIQGVRLGAWDSAPGTAYFSGKRLSCEPAPAGSAYTEVCRIDIPGQPLTLYGRLRLDGEPPMNALGTCAAEYAGQTWPCELQAHHNYAAPVAYISSGLDLDSAQLADLRRRFPIENAPEPAIYNTLITLWPITAVALIVAVLTSWPKARRGKVLDGIAIAVFGVAVTLALPLLLLVAARGFVD